TAILASIAREEGFGNNLHSCFFGLPVTLFFFFLFQMRCRKIQKLGEVPGLITTLDRLFEIQELHSTFADENILRLCVPIHHSGFVELAQYFAVLFYFASIRAFSFLTLLHGLCERIS